MIQDDLVAPLLKNEHTFLPISEKAEGRAMSTVTATRELSP